MRGEEGRGLLNALGGALGYSCFVVTTPTCCVGVIDMWSGLVIFTAEGQQARMISIQLLVTILALPL